MILPLHAPLSKLSSPAKIGEAVCLREQWVQACPECDATGYTEWDEDVVDAHYEHTTVRRSEHCRTCGGGSLEPGCGHVPVPCALCGDEEAWPHLDEQGRIVWAHTDCAEEAA